MGQRGCQHKRNATQIHEATCLCLCHKDKLTSPCLSHKSIRALVLRQLPPLLNTKPPWPAKTFSRSTQQTLNLFIPSEARTSKECKWASGPTRATWPCSNPCSLRGGLLDECAPQAALNVLQEKLGLSTRPSITLLFPLSGCQTELHSQLDGATCPTCLLSTSVCNPTPTPQLQPRPRACPTYQLKH